MKDNFTFKNGVTVSNRIVMAPMTISASTADGRVSDEELVYYYRRAKSGIGMIITACAYIMDNGIAFPDSLKVTQDDDIQELAKVAKSIQDGGAKAVLQIYHGGRMANPKYQLGKEVVSASAIAAPRPNMPTPRALTHEEIESLITAFAEATRRAIEAGFDGVELHGANTYLLQQFVSPHSNQRDDEWGGDVERRFTFPLRVVEACAHMIQEYAKKPFVFGYRVSPEEREEPGITTDDTLAFVRALAKTPLDYVHASVGKFDGGSMRDAEDTTSRVALLQQAVGEELAVIGVGALQTREQVEEALTTVPLVSLGHALIYDPDWYEKMALGLDDAVHTMLYTSKKDELDIPQSLWEMITTIPGWFTVAQEEK